MCITFPQAWIGEDGRNGAGLPLLLVPPSVKAMIAASIGGPEVLSKAIPRAKLLTYPGEGHLFLVNHWAEMLAALR